MRLVVALALGACYSPSYVDCAITCAGGTCPTGYECVANVCRVSGHQGPCPAPVDASMTDSGDDGDGIPFGMDNCPFQANPSQANEDGDALGDACDPCPVFNGAADNQDSDGDGVGDSCDTTPMTPAGEVGERIAHFLGFLDPPVGIEVDPPTGWTIGNDTAKINIASSTNGYLLVPMPDSAVEETVIVRFKPTSIPATVAGSVGVTAKFNRSTTSGVLCQMYMAPGVPPRLELIGGAQSLASTGASALVPNQSYDAKLTRRGVEYTCSRSGAPTSPLNNYSVVGTGLWAGFVTNGVGAEIEWILVITKG